MDVGLERRRCVGQRPLLGEIDQSERRAWETFDLCRELLGYDEHRCERHEMSVHDVSLERLGRFDVVFFFGTLYHLRHPLLALERLAGVCDDAVYVESAVLDDFSPYRGGLGHGYPEGQMVMELYPGPQYGDNASNGWVPTLHCLLHMLGVAGFTHQARAHELSAAPEALSRCRGFARARRPPRG